MPDQILSALLQEGEYCCVAAPLWPRRRLRIQTADRLRAGEGGAVMASAEQDDGGATREGSSASERQVWLVVLNLAALGPCETAAEWYGRLLALLGPQVGLEEELAEFWRTEERLSPVQRWIDAICEVVLPQSGVQAFRRSGVLNRQSTSASASATQTPECLDARTLERLGRLVIFIDEIEAVRGLPFSTDEFFSAVRECYNRRAREPELRRLTFCLLGDVPVSSLIRNPATTWFNIGQRLGLTEAGEAAVPTPRAGCGRSPARVLLRRARDWICGEPYWFVSAAPGVAACAASLAAPLK